MVALFFWLAAVLVLLLAPQTPGQVWTGPPRITKLGNQKVLTLISRDPPWVRQHAGRRGLTSVYQFGPDHSTDDRQRCQGGGGVLGRWADRETAARTTAW